MSVRVIELAVDTLLPRDRRRGATRTLCYTNRDHEIVVDVTVSAAAAVMAIHVTPPGRVGIDVLPLHGISRRVWTDADGRARCGRVPLGPVSLVVNWPASAGGPVRTAWTQV